MALSDYVPSGQGEFCALLIHVKNTLPDYYITLGINAATPKVSLLLTDVANFDYICQKQSILAQASQASTRERNRARYGDKANPHVALDLSLPSGPATVPSPVMPGIEKRFREFVEWLRSLDGYTDAIGEALHLIGDDTAAPDTASLKPDLGKITIDGGKVIIPWKWNGAQPVAKALRLECDDNTGGGFKHRATDPQPGYVDRTPFPATPVKIRYRAIFLGDDEEPIGQYSDIIEITVG
jgi:hypothetical protein